MHAWAYLSVVSVGTSIRKEKKKGRPWNPRERSYGRYRIDVPGERGQKEVRVAVGYCRDELDAMLRLQVEMKSAGALDLIKVRECVAPAVTFRSQAAWWIDEMTAGRSVNASTPIPFPLTKQPWCI